MQTGLGSAVNVGLEDVSQGGGEWLLQTGIRKPPGVKFRQREVVGHGKPQDCVCAGAVPCASESLVGFTAHLRAGAEYMWEHNACLRLVVAFGSWRQTSPPPAPCGGRAAAWQARFRPALVRLLSCRRRLH